MGLVCSRCASVEKGKTGGADATHVVPDLESDIEEGMEDESHGAESSDEGDHESQMKQGVEKILRETGKNLKRGKTMAMKEAISTAKKHNLDKTKICEAEQALTDHKRRQLQEDTEKEVAAFFESPQVGLIPAAEKIVKKVLDAQCREEVRKRVEDHLQELVLTRPMEPQEEEQALCFMKQSCREFFMAAVAGDGRPVTLLGLDDGQFKSGRLSLDPPLTILRLVHLNDGGPEIKMPLSSVNAYAGKDETRTKASRVFQSLDGPERDCIVAVRYEADGVSGVLVFQEPTRGHRDRLQEAMVILRSTAVGDGASAAR